MDGIEQEAKKNTNIIDLLKIFEAKIQLNRTQTFWLKFQTFVVRILGKEQENRRQRTFMAGSFLCKNVTVDKFHYI